MQNNQCHQQQSWWNGIHEIIRMNILVLVAFFSCDGCCASFVPSFHTALGTVSSSSSFLPTKASIVHPSNRKPSLCNHWYLKEKQGLSDALSSFSSEETLEQSDTTQKQKQKQKRKNTAAASSALWVACASTKEMTRAVNKYVQEGDAVAEIGSQLRETSLAIQSNVGADDKGGYALFVDVKRKFPTKDTLVKDGQQDKAKGGRTNAMRRENDALLFCSNDNNSFVEIPTFEEWRRVLFWNDATNEEERRRPTTYDALVVDVPIVAGNDLDLTCVSLITDFLALNDHTTTEKKCRVVIIKSKSMQNLAKRLIHSQRLFDFGVDSLPTLPKFALQGDTTSIHTNPSKANDDTDFNNNVIHAPSPAIIGTLGVEEYRRTIPYVIKKGCNVLEVGCHHGTTAAILHDAASVATSSSSESIDASGGGCLGIDIGPSIIKGAKKRYPTVPFAVGDAFRTADLLMMKEQYLPSSSSSPTTTITFPQYDAVYVDVGGLSGSDGLLESLSLLTALGNALRPKCIVIKSLCVKRLASSLVPFSAIWWKERQQQLQQKQQDNEA